MASKLEEMKQFKRLRNAVEKDRHVSLECGMNSYTSDVTEIVISYQAYVGPAPNDGFGKGKIVSAPTPKEAIDKVLKEYKNDLNTPQ